ncbi:MAG: hypothetical protein E7163_00165 [Firmicutes bacterium]|nr:hypothetical protein [Bacillota bacterium]
MTIFSTIIVKYLSFTDIITSKCAYCIITSNTILNNSKVSIAIIHSISNPFLQLNPAF